MTAELTTRYQDLFDAPVALADGALRVGELRYPVVDDVVVLLPPEQWPPDLAARLGRGGFGPSGAAHGPVALRRGPASAPAPDAALAADAAFAPDIQFTFGEEWKTYGDILPEHEGEFRRYFDLVDLSSLRDARLCDLGCGIGRWARFLAPHCREIVLLDFSEAIFVARRNLKDASNALFFMGDIMRLPFKKNFCDLLYSLGVLHHLPAPCLEVARALKPFAPRQLYFLYYALDNRPWYFRAILKVVTVLRQSVCLIRSPFFRRVFSKAVAFFVYLPLVLLGKLLRPLGLARHVPLYDFYHDKSLRRIEQDVYDRFFTRIEQRVTKAEIEGLRDTFPQVTVSPDLPYWHFLCQREKP